MLAGLGKTLPAARSNAARVAARQTVRAMATIKGSTVPGEMQRVTFGNNLPGYVCGEKGAPAVVVLQMSLAACPSLFFVPSCDVAHEWWGVVPTIVDHALRLSQEGYRCLVPDLYKGKIGVDKEEASHLLSKLDWVAAVDEIKQAVEFLRGEGAPKVGAIGFCMGGALTLCAAQHAGIDAANPFYGLPGPEICQPESIKVPVYLHHGALDDMKGFSDPESAKAFADKVNAAGGNAALFVYEGSGHGFLNVGEEALAKRAHMGFPEPPASAQELAWSRVLELFGRTLKA